MARTYLSRRAALAASAAMTALCGATPALAQDVVPPVAASNDGEGQVITVTAQKREEDVQDVPISISVVGGETLVESGVAQISDFANYVPGFHADNLGTPGQSRIALRGISPLAASASVGVYLDDAPVGSSVVYTETVAFTLDLMPYDLERVEILRGPQGTLYGASTIGGLLKYVTISPSLTETSGRVGGELFTIAHGDGVGYALQGMVNIAAGGNVGITASFAHRSSPGWIENVQTGDEDVNDFEQTGARVSLLWQPSAEFSARLSAIWQHIETDSNSITSETPAGVPVGRRATFSFIDEPFESDLQIYAATLTYDFGFATLSSTSTYQDSERTELTDGSRIFGNIFPLLTGGAIAEGIAPFEATIALQKFTQEVRLTSASGGVFEWMIGGFYTNEDATHDQIVTSFDMAGNAIPALTPLAIAALPSTYEEYAIFGNATFRFTEQFRVTGGLRWAHNDQTFRQISTGAVVPTADIPGESSEGVFTFSISPQYHINDDTMVYARAASGYRPGGPNVFLPGVPPTFDADTVINYELGFKMRLREPSLALDVALFRMDWDDVQVSTSFGGVGGLDNGGTARSQGIEASLVWQPVPRLTIGVNGAYTDAELTEDAPAVDGLKGDRLPRIPRFSGAITASYGFDLGPTTEAEIGGGIRHTGHRFSDVESSPDRQDIGSYTAVDLNASLSFNERFRVRLYVRNLTDSEGPQGRALVRDAIGRPSFINVIPLQPRTIGVAFDVNF